MDDYRLEDETERMRGHLSLEFDTFSPELYDWGIPAIINPPPALIVCRGLVQAIRYRPRELSGGDYRAERRRKAMPVGLFVLSGGCAGSALKK
jgi:hypothetical protein